MPLLLNLPSEANFHHRHLGRNVLESQDHPLVEAEASGMGRARFRHLRPTLVLRDKGSVSTAAEVVGRVLVIRRLRHTRLSDRATMIQAGAGPSRSRFESVAVPVDAGLSESGDFRVF